jgi:hypothetical protein
MILKIILNKKEVIYESIDINTYNEKTRNILITQYFYCERLCFFKQFKVATNNFLKKIYTLIFFEMINNKIYTHMYMFKLFNNIKKGKRSHINFQIIY